MERTTKKERKAIVLCGGMGMRLRPLTANTPKPLLKINGVPVVVNILKMLRSRGFRQVGLTVGYKGRDFERLVKGYLRQLEGLDLRFFYEEQPLGSAGGVKAAADFLDCDFAVICGDAWCDFHIDEGFELLDEKNCSAVIVTTKTNTPLEYGLVMTDDDGRIVSFTEKPSWSGVCSDLVNTGIYIFKKEILGLIPNGRYDFGRDLFSKMLGEGMAIYSHPLKGKWCDIGDPVAYYRCNMEQTEGKNYIADGCDVSPSAVVEGSVILEGCVVKAGAVIKGAVVGEGSVIGDGANIKQGCVIGPNSVIGKGCVIHPGVFIGNGERLEDGACVFNPLHGVNLFVNRCMRFDLYSTSPVFWAALGRAVRRAVGEKEKIAVMYSLADGCQSAVEGVLKGISVDDEVSFDCMDGSDFVASFTARDRGYNTMIYISGVMERDGKSTVRIDFFDENGTYPGAAFESKVISSARWASSLENYQLRVKRISDCNEKYLGDVISQTDLQLSCLKLDYEGDSKIIKYLEAARDKYKKGGEKHEMKVIFKQDGGVEGAVYNGVYFDFDHVICCVILNYIKKGVTEIPLPHRSPAAIKKFIRDNGARLTLYSLCCHDPRENAVKGCFAYLPALQDPCRALLCFAEYMSSSQKKPEEIAKALPEFCYLSCDEYVPQRAKEKVIGMSCHSGEGFLMEDDKVRLIPENSNVMSVCVEAADMGDAREMLKRAREYLKRLSGNKND